MTLPNKSIVILTNFWDANAFLDQNFVSLTLFDDQIFKINFLRDDNETFTNIKVYSVALSNPSFDKLPNVKNAYAGRLDMFCPTWDLLNAYKDDGLWVDYENSYIELLRGRKDSIQKWIKTLDVNTVYILCCWENTSGETHCHRDIMYSAFRKSTLAKKKMYPVYRTGSATISRTSD